MLPTHLLPQLTPAAAKLYLTLASLADRRQRVPLARASQDLLCRLTNFSSATCERALRQLRALQLVQPLPRRHHQTTTYLLPPVPARPSPVMADATSPSPMMAHSTDPSPAMAHPNPNPSPVMANSSSASHATPNITPITPLPSPVMPIQTLAPPITDDALLDPSAIQQCLADASPALHAQILLASRQALQRPDATPQARATAIAILAAAASLDPIASLKEPYP